MFEMANGVTDTTTSWERLAGVASTLLGSASQRKRASACGDPALNQVHLHRRSSSLVSDLTVDGISDDDDCCFKCPRVLERLCCSPDVLGSPTGTSVLQPPSTPSACGAQPAALQHQPDNHRAAPLLPSPVLKGPASFQRLQQLQWSQSEQRQPPRLARRSCPSALALTPPRSPAGAVTASAAGAAPMPAVQLNSLLLVASQLAGSGSSAAARDCSSPLLPATQAALQATTASVIAAELAAAAVAEQAVPASAGAGSPASVAVTDECEYQPQSKHLALPSWLRSGSAGLAASAAICRASLLSTTAALARLSQQQLTAAGTAQQLEQQQQAVQACLFGAQAAAAAAPVAAPVLQQAGAQGMEVPVALGIPVAGGIVVGMPVHPQQQQQQQQQQQHEAATVAQCGVTGRIFDFQAAGACANGHLCMSNLRLPPLTCGDQEQPNQQGSMQCDDATSCCSTPRSGAAAAPGSGVSEDVRQVADAAARLLLSSSSGSRRRRCCWEAEAMDVEQCGDVMDSDGESADLTFATTAAAGEGEGLGQQVVCAQPLAPTVGGAAACAVVVLVDVAAKRSSNDSKEAQQLVESAAACFARPAVSAGCCGESPWGGAAVGEM